MLLFDSSRTDFCETNICLEIASLEEKTTNNTGLKQFHDRVPYFLDVNFFGATIQRRAFRFFKAFLAYEARFYS